MKTVDKFFFVFANAVLAATALILIGEDMLPILLLPMALGGIAFLPWLVVRSMTGFPDHPSGRLLQGSCIASLVLGICCIIGMQFWLVLLGLGFPISIIPVAVAGWISLRTTDLLTAMQLR